MYEILSACLQVMLALGRGYCLQYFFGNFLECRIKDRRIGGLAVIAVYAALDILVSALLPSELQSAGSVRKTLLFFLVIVMLALLFYKGFHAVTAFLTVTFLAVGEIVFFLSYTLMRLSGGLFDFLVWLLEKDYIGADMLEQLASVIVIAVQFFFYSIFLVLSYVILRKIAESFRDKDHDIHRTELYFLIVPGMAGLLICVLLRIMMITIEDDVPQILYDRYPVFNFLVPAILILSLLAIFYSVKTFQDMIALNREKNSRIIMEKQIGNMQEHMTEMERVYSGVRSMKHDMKNTLAVIMQLAAQNGGEENTELQAYLSELHQTMDRLDMEFHTGNAVADTLLNMKYHEALSALPDIRFDAQGLLFPETFNIHSYDIGVILGNALDNAVEACRKLKAEDAWAEAFIRLYSFQKGKMFFVEVENSFDGTVIRRHWSEFPATDKADRETHGIGMANIKSVAEKYHGAVEWTVSGNVFTLSVMMKNERRPENEY